MSLFSKILDLFRRHPAALPDPRFVVTDLDDFDRQLAANERTGSAIADPVLFLRDEMPWLVREGRLNEFTLGPLLTTFPSPLPDGSSDSELPDPALELGAGGQTNVPALLAAFFNQAARGSKAQLLALTVNHTNWFDRALLFHGSGPEAVSPDGSSHRLVGGDADALIRSLVSDLRATYNLPADLPVYGYLYEFDYDTSVFSWKLLSSIGSFPAVQDAA